MAYAKAKKLDIDAIPLIDVAPIFEGPAGERHVVRMKIPDDGICIVKDGLDAFADQTGNRRFGQAGKCGTLQT